jgi:methyl-accepting chemotaxis protein
MPVTIESLNIISLESALTGPTAGNATSQKNLPVLSPNGTNAQPPANAPADAVISGSPSNSNIYVSGNGTTANGAITNSNKNLAHACDSSTYVGRAINQVGAFGGQIVQAIRNAIKAILAYFGINPSSSGLVNQLKKIAQDIKDAAVFIKKITNAITQFISYVNAIKQLLAYILSLPAVLLAYFKDCIATLRKQLVAGYQSALDNTPDPSESDINQLSGAIKDVQSSIQQVAQAAAGVVSAAATATISLLTPTQVSSGNTQQQAAATQEIFSAAGFSPTSGNFAKP